MKQSGRSGSVGRRTLLSGSGSYFLAAPALRAHAQTAGVALVIGNSKYQWEAPLPNVRRDAPDVAKAFQQMGLKTELVQEANRSTLTAALENFKAAARGASFAAFYYAGHGASWERKSYLVPVDADLSDPKAVAGLIPVKSPIEAAKAAAHSMVALDNCRNNPGDGWRQEDAALSASSRFLSSDGSVASGSNVLVLYSTAPGNVALDGPAGQNSPFAASVLQQLQGGTVDIQSLPGKIRRDLLVATQGRQVLFDINGYAQPFALPGSRGAPSRPDSGSAGSSNVELKGAYSFAQEKNLPCPDGLVAFRLPEGSSERSKIGSFKTTLNANNYWYPGVLIVLNVVDGIAPIVFCRSGVSRDTGRDQFGRMWDFRLATVKDKELIFRLNHSGSLYRFEWKRPDSGSLTQIWENDRPKSSVFERLDG